MGFSDPVNIFFIVKKHNFRGDLSNISAKTASLCRAVMPLQRMKFCMENPTTIKRVNDSYSDMVLQYVSSSFNEDGCTQVNTFSKVDTVLVG